jgi:hypothetical protein
MPTLSKSHLAMAAAAPDQNEQAGPGWRAGDRRLERLEFVRSVADVARPGWPTAARPGRPFLVRSMNGEGSHKEEMPLHGYTTD